MLEWRCGLDAVSRKHFYFARINKEYYNKQDQLFYANYTIYKDQGKKVGDFSIAHKTVYADVFLCVNNDKFYLVLNDDYLKYGVIDFQKQEIHVINDTMSKYKTDTRVYGFSRDYNRYFPYTLYNDKIYLRMFKGNLKDQIYYRTNSYEEWSGDKELTEYLGTVSCDKKTKETKVCNYKRFGKNNNLFFVDNKIFYAIAKGKKCVYTVMI